MAVTGMHYNWGWAYGGSDQGISTSLEYNFSPTFAAAQTSLSMTVGGGGIWCGITQYRKRATPSGPDQDVNFSFNPDFGYPPSVYDPHMTSVTAELEMGAQQQGVFTLNVWFFG